MHFVAPAPVANPFFVDYAAMFSRININKVLSTIVESLGKHPCSNIGIHHHPDKRNTQKEVLSKLKTKLGGKLWHCDCCKEHRFSKRFSTANGGTTCMTCYNARTSGMVPDSDKEDQQALAPPGGATGMSMEENGIHDLYIGPLCGNVRTEAERILEGMLFPSGRAPAQPTPNQA